MRALKAKIVGGKQRKSFFFTHKPSTCSWLLTQSPAESQILFYCAIPFDECVALALAQFEMLPGFFNIGLLEVVNGKLQLTGQLHVGKCNRAACIRISR